MALLENWIKNYTAKVGMGMVDSVKFNEYFSKEKEINSLNEKEKEAMKMLLGFYEKLKLSSLTTLGIEDIVLVDTPEFKGQIRDGRLEKQTKLDANSNKLLNIIMGPETENGDTRSVNKPTAIKGAGGNQEEYSEIDKLQQEIDKYPEGSIERKALEEELAKLDKK